MLQRKAAKEYDLMLQEELMPDRWKMLIGCMLLNQTTRHQAELVWRELFARWPTPFEMEKADPADVASVIRPCGFQNRRARSIIKFSQQWLDWPDDTPIEEFAGIGKYAADSYRIFVEGRYHIDVEDKELRRYLEDINKDTKS